MFKYNARSGDMFSFGDMEALFLRTTNPLQGKGWQLGLTTSGRIVMNGPFCNQTPAEVIQVQQVPQGNFILGPLSQ